eukprot:GHVU01038249.1.p2 GENE.GHVU01038249.1~~GHVU01038249.1.p2  ORF type:complete len:209 (+),score=41.22 GHVU01038249.1:4681-5307(+)
MVEELQNTKKLLKELKFLTDTKRMLEEWNNSTMYTEITDWLKCNMKLVHDYVQKNIKDKVEITITQDTLYTIEKIEGWSQTDEGRTIAEVECFINEATTKLEALTGSDIFKKLEQYETQYQQIMDGLKNKAKERLTITGYSHEDVMERKNLLMHLANGLTLAAQRFFDEGQNTSMLEIMDEYVEGLSKKQRKNKDRSTRRRQNVWSVR